MRQLPSTSSIKKRERGRSRRGVGHSNTFCYFIKLYSEWLWGFECILIEFYLLSCIRLKRIAHFKMNLYKFPASLLLRLLHFSSICCCLIWVNQVSASKLSSSEVDDFHSQQYVYDLILIGMFNLAMIFYDIGYLFSSLNMCVDIDNPTFSLGLGNPMALPLGFGNLDFRENWLDKREDKIVFSIFFVISFIIIIFLLIGDIILRPRLGIHLEVINILSF